jgi:hypothetical protein
MADIAMILVAAFMRAIVRRGRVPFRIGQVTPSVARIKGVAAMYASLKRHAGQDTRRGCKSVLVSDENRRLAKDVACDSNDLSRAGQTNYLPKLTWRWSVISLQLTDNKANPERAAPSRCEIACSARFFRVYGSITSAKAVP